MISGLDRALGGAEEGGDEVKGLDGLVEGHGEEFKGEGDRAAG